MLTTDERVNETVRSCLPERCLAAIENVKIVNEIRMRSGGPLSVTSRGCNLRFGVICTREEVERTVERLCRGSLHAFGETIKNGFIPIEGGCRAGICGRAVTSDGRVTAISDISGVNIRISHAPDGETGDGGLAAYLAAADFRQSVLIYSPPAVGKTTLLRELAINVSSPPHSRRVALVDCRRELFDGPRMRGCLLDVFFDYPKAAGIETAVRTMSPELIVCDELGSLAESEALLSAQSCGVPVTASAHAADLTGLLRRKNIRLLHDGGMFDVYARLSRSPDGGFSLDFHTREETDALCCG